MSAHLLLNLLKTSWGKVIKCEACILLLFRNEFNDFNNTGARTLNTFYYRTLKLLKNSI